MELFTLADLSRNAFRTLGLTAAADQGDIDAAARRLRIWDDPSAIPPTRNDAPWLGPVHRGKQDIEAAVARLADPQSRVQQRLWWFCAAPPASDRLPGHELAEATARHDLALLHLYRALIVVAAEGQLERWQSVIARFEELATSDDYLAWLLDVEAAGDYEMHASPDETAQAQHAMPERLSTALARHSDEAIDSDDFGTAGEMVRILRGTGAAEAPRRGPSADPATKILDRMEDALAGRCAAAAEAVDAAWETRKIAALRPACNRAVAEFDRTLHPLVRELVTAAGGDLDRQHRACMQGARLLDHVAQAYEAMYEFIIAERTQQKAVELARGTSLEHMLLARLDQIRPAARRQHLGYGPLQRRPPAGQENQQEPRPVKVFGGGTRNYSGSWLSHVPLRLVVFLAIVVLGAVSRLNFNSTNSTPYDLSRPGVDPKFLNSPEFRNSPLFRSLNGQAPDATKPGDRSPPPVGGPIQGPDNAAGAAPVSPPPRTNAPPENTHPAVPSRPQPPPLSGGGAAPPAAPGRR